jgi:hypothetical protein
LQWRGESQEFKLSPQLTQGSGCYLMSSYKGVIGVEGIILESGFSSIYGAWWSIESSNNGGSAILHCVSNCGQHPIGCLDRRTPDDDREAQVIECKGIPHQKFALQTTQ